MVEAAPDPITTGPPVGVPAQSVAYNASTAIVAATQAVASQSVAISDAANALKVKRTACEAQPAGATGALAYASDSPSAFLANPGFSDAASAASTPAGYTQSFQNIKASNNANGYMRLWGSLLLKIMIRNCVHRNVRLSTDTLNVIQVVIAGSNGYTNKIIAPIPGYGNAQYLGNTAINAPYDSQGCNTYMGPTMFSTGPFDASLCAAYCSAQSKYNLEHPPSDRSPVKTCQFFNTYLLYVNDLRNTQGQYCAIYSEAWDSSYATNATTPTVAVTVYVTDYVSTTTSTTTTSTTTTSTTTTTASATPSFIIAADTEKSQYRKLRSKIHLDGTSLYSSDKTRVADTDGGSSDTPSYIFMDTVSVAANFPLIQCKLGTYDASVGGYPLSCIEGTSAAHPVLKVGDASRLVLADKLGTGNYIPSLYAILV
ncbi:hypothetical protein BGAL_0107g00100 [Botrytis galanthina]|uniref:Apple domain-containing protein n=1 Tax=Botrytis galanthina TaxID=278940 RepID=A0A4S8R1C9_9HELO|nr:hypothetical protein BGAL_0107g00100 [Botrytis galanthina]